MTSERDVDREGRTPNKHKFGLSFCKIEMAGGSTPWHIRRLTAVGRKLGGGADTPSLCGRTVAWDVAVPLTAHDLMHCCQRCRELAREVIDAD